MFIHRIQVCELIFLFLFLLTVALPGVRKRIELILVGYCTSRIWLISHCSLKE